MTSPIYEIYDSAVNVSASALDLFKTQVILWYYVKNDYIQMYVSSSDFDIDKYII